MTEETNYPTDRFGNPDGRDYHYRIPLNDEMAMRLANWALHGMGRYSERHVYQWDGFSGDPLSYMGIQTHDSKGHLEGLAEHSHSPKWETVGSPGNRWEIRNGNGGGTRIRGPFTYCPHTGTEITLQFDTVVPPTPTEVKAAVEKMGDTYRKIVESIGYAKDDAIEQYQERKAELQRQCEHEHTLREATNPEAVEYCEDCQAELTEDGEMVPPFL